jgi:hypothetical protein
MWYGDRYCLSSRYDAALRHLKRRATCRHVRRSKQPHFSITKPAAILDVARSHASSAGIGWGHRTRHRGTFQVHENYG